ncbi:prepilin-type N-terminal cleavage/methylation domain-containing protein [Corticibacter populi]|uniref:Prepilin-type N-terminal cleavage/methylation domain-containing protein n=2 Tax=Corticibacter populi TaxID=1550736 RepID=A0A3M6QQL6_9BURK|nr:prepilin-type N-terminal cleavage/methylation domain-containing protein [Corticibacter populi]
MQRPGRRGHGFTLIEVMVAVALLALVTAVSWRGIDGMLRAQEFARRNADELAVVQTALAQWQTDLEQLASPVALTPLDWDGKVLRITRNSPRVRAQDTPALRVVAWSDRNVDGRRYWVRWQSGPLFGRTQWNEAWQAAQRWSQMPGTTSQLGQDIALLPITDWRLFYARDGRWSNPLSSDQTQAGSSRDGVDGTGSGDAAGYLAPASTFALPDAIRLQLDLAPGQALSGAISRDWLNPQLGMTRP